MSTTVFNCSNDRLTEEVFMALAVCHGTLQRLGQSDQLPVELVSMDDFEPYFLGSKDDFEAKDRVIIAWRGEKTFELYAIGSYNILEEMRIEHHIRKQAKGGFVTIFKGLRDADDCIHFYRKTEHGQRVVSRYFSTPAVA